MPGVYWSSTGSELRPVKKVEILALDENATLLLLFHARTHGSESVWCHVVRLSVLALKMFWHKLHPDGLSLTKEFFLCLSRTEL